MMYHGSERLSGRDETVRGVFLATREFRVARARTTSLKQLVQ